jgi:hypothetical protein
MPQVPYTGTPAVAPDLRPTPEIHVNAPEAAFGMATAQATERAGRVGEGVGSELFSRAIAMQELGNQAKGIEGQAQFATAAGDLYEKFRENKGIDAKNAYPVFQDSIDKLREKVGEQFTDPYTKLQFQRDSRQLQQRLSIAAGAHAGEQFDQYQLGALKAKGDIGVKTVSMLPMNDAAYEDGLKKNAEAADQYRTTTGSNNDVRDDYLLKENSKLVDTRARAMARQDPGAADRFLTDAINKGNIDGETAGRASDYIRSHLNNVTTRVESAKLMNGEGGYFGEGKVSQDTMLRAIRQIEGGGSYNPSHPADGKYKTNHALGAYGIMQNNLQPWLKEAGMPAMSEKEFLADHDAQDKLAAFKLGQLQDQYGSANKAAMVWFTGKPDPDPNVSDGFTTAAQYKQRFNAALARHSGDGVIADVASKRAGEISPNNPELPDLMSRAAINHMYVQKQVEKEERTSQLDTLHAALQPAEDGKVPTRLEDITDPAAHEAFNNLKSQKDKDAFLKQLDVNARDGGYKMTAGNAGIYAKYKGALNDPFASDDERKEALETDIYSLPLPWKERNELINYQKKDLAQMDKNPVLSSAIETLRPTLDAMHIGTKEDKGKAQYHEFIGKLQTAIEERMQETGKPIKQEEIKALGAGMLRTFKSSTWWGLSSKETPEFQRKDYPQKAMDEARQQYIQRYGYAPSPQTLDQIMAAASINAFYSKQSEKK